MDGERDDMRSTPRRSAHARGVVLLAFGQVISWAALYYSFAALLIDWERDLGWAKADLTLGLTAAVLLSGAFAPLAGRIIDLGHGRLLLALGPAFGAAGLIGVAASEGTTAFISLWAFIGIAQAACLYEACFAFVTLNLASAARKSILHVTLIAGFASPVAFLLGGAIADLAGWRVAVLSLAGLALLVAAPLNWIGAGLLQTGTPRRKSASDETGSAGVMRYALRKRGFWLIGIAFSLVALNHGLLINHLIPLLVEQDVRESTAFLAAACIGPMQVAGRLALLPFESRFSSFWLSLAACLGLVLAAMLLLGAGSIALLAFAFAGLQGASYGLTSVLRPGLTAETLGRRGFGSISGWLALPYLVGFAFAPTVGSYLWTAGGYDLAILAALAFGLTAFLCLLGLPRQ